MNNDVRNAILRIAGWGLTGALFAPLAAVLVLSGAGWLITLIAARGYPALFTAVLFGVWCWIVLIAVAIIQGRRNHNAAERHGLLWLLAVSAERSMPVAPAVAAFARERGGRFGRRARRLAEMLTAGVPLPDALDRIGGLLPPYALPMLRVGAEAGALAPALRDAATAGDPREPIWGALAGRIVYVLFLLTHGLMIIAFAVWVVGPRIEKIAMDFKDPLPFASRLLISLAVGYTGYIFLGLYLLALLLLICAIVRYWGWTDWDLPGVARLVRRLDSAEILDSLALVARQQRPLGDGITALARSYPKHDIRRRLSQTEADVRAGRDWCESLRDHGLIQAADLAVLQAAQRVGNLPWALQEMADSARRRLTYRVQAIIQAAFPLMVVLVGVTVMFVVVALFLPLITLIESQSMVLR